MTYINRHIYIGFNRSNLKTGRHKKRTATLMTM